MNIERGLLRVLLWPVHRAALRLSGGRVGTEEPKPDGVGTLVLATTGRRSGARRERPVFFIRDGERYVVVASNAGDERDPDWWLNLKARPEAEVQTGGAFVPVIAREATDEDERRRLWAELVRRNPGYARYELRTERPIPVVILQPR